MALVLNEDQVLLQESAKGFLNEKAPVAALRALRDSRDATGYSRDLWREMVEMGWAGIVVPEEHGGLDFGFLGAGLLCREMGRTLTASPFFSTALVAASLIGRAGSTVQKQDLLPRIAAGQAVIALALDESGRHGPEMTATTASRTDTGWRLDGTKQFVLDAHVADTLIVVARTGGSPGEDGGLTLFLVDPARRGVTVSRSILVDSRNVGEVALDGAEVDQAAVLGQVGGGLAPLQETLDIGRICLAAELLGVAEECFERTIEYLKDRQQFGVPIGSFQSLQHRAAQLYGEIELGKSTVLKALQGIDEGSNRLPLLASLAKARLGETARLAAAEAIQMHGGIGMTDEVDIGLFAKRAQAVSQIFGGETYHADRFARLSGY